MTIIIDGKGIATRLKSDLKEKISKLRIPPCLAVVIVGNDLASKIYVKNKEKSCKECGIRSIKYELPSDISEIKLLELIEKINNDDKIDGLLVQLPLPKHIDKKKVILAISPRKDVDCFTPVNIGNMFNGTFDFETSLLPCTPKGCIRLIKSVCSDLSGKKACIVGRSNIVGKPASQLLLNEDCTIKIIHSKTENLSDEIKWADILIVAVGKPKFITADMIKDGVIVIDVGMNRYNEKLCGDVDFNNVINKVHAITPVPGGVGPMTIAMLMENMYNIVKSQKSESLEP
ncbi:MAG: bifunctional 5,10-methylenetetrahydrofolate dehydrogenase/5,10-methenyltetrahydrofolate cyclohydrolase [Rickettsiales bacterium]|jgi:methylenetetrahydrofolate dehydrogenase (NADP+)/methenyltetrahydrofolate cyclohydrolase|nr:bifunctional 5,10-methylenetetrahydrofolate dehydrogenase/5,10-methenyltetrahydrofolate cyclohydrolase [Rickettsiales bacterium]